MQSVFSPRICSKAAKLTVEEGYTQGVVKEHVYLHKYYYKKL